MLKTLITLLALFSIGSLANAQSEDATLIFKRPYAGSSSRGGDWHTAKISIGEKEICSLDSDFDKISSCFTNVNAGEIVIKVSSSRGSDFYYAIDVMKDKTYTFVVYVRNSQIEDMIWSNMNLIKNKAPESENYNKISFKTQVISIK